MAAAPGDWSGMTPGELRALTDALGPKKIYTKDDLYMAAANGGELHFIPKEFKDAIDRANGVDPVTITKDMHIHITDSRDPITIEKKDELVIDASQSETVFQLDKFDLEKGTRLNSKNGIVDPPSWADFHAMNYLPDPQMTGNCYDKRRQEMIDIAQQSSDHNVLRQSTIHNLVASDIAAESFATEYINLFKKDEERRQKNERRKRAGKKVDDATEQLLSEMAAVKATAAALKQAVDSVEELEEACKMFGLDPSDPQTLDAGRVARLFARIRGSKELRRICELAGRYRRIAQSKQRQKILHGYDDMVGVELSGDVGRLLPVELARLADEDTEFDTMRRIVEKQTMCREHRGMEPIGKGPIVICVDESGSMKGDPICNAKAFALSMAYIAKQQRRWCCLVSYSTDPMGYVMAFKPNQWREDLLMDWMVHFYNGGTVMDVPLRIFPYMHWSRIGAPKGKTDMVIITDGECEVPKEMKEMFLKWKKANQVRCIGLVMADKVGPLAGVCDESYLINSISPDEQGIQQCLSV